MIAAYVFLLSLVATEGRLVTNSDGANRRDIEVTMLCQHSATVPILLSRPLADSVTLKPAEQFDCGISLSGNEYKIDHWTLDATPEELPVLPSPIRALAQNGNLRVVEAKALLKPSDPATAPFSELVSSGLIWATTAATADTPESALTGLSVPPVGAENINVQLPADRNRSLFTSEVPDMKDGTFMTLIKEEVDSLNKPRALLVMEKPLKASVALEAALARIDAPVIDQAALQALESDKTAGEPIRLFVKFPTQAAN